MKHQAEIFAGRFGVYVYGCGGTGCQILTGLARIHHAITALGHPGFRVLAYDEDTVSETNVGRQLFSPADVGQNKATVLINRINLFYGLDWMADPRDDYHRSGISIVCVDSRKARRRLSGVKTDYIMDCGNRDTTGQVVIGGCGMVSPYKMFPELVDTKIKEDKGPSCSMAEALESQDLFINQAVATYALHLLWTLLRHGGLDHQGYFINLAGSVRPIPIQWTTKNQTK